LANATHAGNRAELAMFERAGFTVAARRLGNESTPPALSSGSTLGPGRKIAMSLVPALHVGVVFHGDVLALDVAPWMELS
jgi:hypothetical protein